ncbi:hypothetical protein [Bradyrhizobium sp.]|uniref:hypothetical protein n=1 Tax=Bradyrhizobium sp. TaxID=376 RepID=UPI002D7F6B6F|nr:hypothetical protein [Bradyrhizobium sp.]
MTAIVDALVVIVVSFIVRTIVEIRDDQAVAIKNLFRDQLSREQNDVDARWHDFRLWIGSSLDQAIMTHRDYRKRRSGRAVKQGLKLWMKPLTTRGRETAELTEGGRYCFRLS